MKYLEKTEEFYHEINKIDMILSGIDGFTMTKIIRDIDSILPIIIISTKNDIETKINVLKIGADDYITKPLI